ncbi:DEAD/DEAH box helicase [Rubrobacter radiotolerans]|nr:DEAD/DEAH box helicase [Rubrobacter radiotolerans]SMC01662.1 CRISPR-associated endonuclease/helicase Cas3 [Rubrobacter radiotolerans DSM 5868]
MTISTEELKSAFRRVLHGEEPYSHQVEFGREVMSERNAILSAGTGSGKTEAALVPALLSGKRVFLLYPTKALLHDQFGRVEKIANNVLDKSPRIVVDTGDDDDATGYSADIVLTNLDKFVFRMFGYGKKRYGYSYPFRLTRDRRKSLLIFDEAHAYDETIFAHLWFVLNKLTYEKRVQTLLLSATLPEKFITALRDVEHRAFPRPDTEGFFALVEDAERRTGTQLYSGTVSQDEAIEKAARLFADGRRVVLIFRRIRGDGGLQAAWKKLRGELGGEMARVEDGNVVGSVLAYHGGQLPPHRKRVLKRLLELDGEKEPYLLLATHAMEVGVDISTEVMFCGAGGGEFMLDPDGFVQQIGRCARRRGESGEVFLMLDKEGEVPSFAEKLEEGAEISPETKRSITAMNEPPDTARAEGGIEYLHDEALYRYVHDHVPENRELWERGVLVTRDWEPNIELVFSEERDGETWIGGLPQQRFWGGDEVSESVSLTMGQAVLLAPRCAWVFTGRDEANDSTVRLALGGEKQRTLDEVRGQLGYPNMRDARQAPIMLLAPEGVRKEIFEDDNLGLSAEGNGEIKSIYSGYPNITRYEATLKKRNPSTTLKLQWDEPKKPEEE